MDGSIRTEAGNVISDGKHVSMNMWGLTPDFITILQKCFTDLCDGDIKSEYLLLSAIVKLLEKEEVLVKVLETPDKWFGVTYQGDPQPVMDAFGKLIEKGIYKSFL